MATFALVNLLEDLYPLFLTYAALVYPRDATLLELVVDDGVGTCSTFDLSGNELVRREFVVGEVGEEGLGPWRRLIDDEDLNGFRLGRSRPVRLRSRRHPNGVGAWTRRD